IFVSIWILKDAPLQNVSRWWALGALILPFLVPYYLIKTRPLNKYWKLIGLWLLGFFVIHAIGTVMIKLQTSNVPKSSNQVALWKTFVSNDKAFTVHFPTEPNRESDVLNPPSGKVELIQYTSKHKDILYAVMYGDYSSNALVGMTSEQLLDNARNGAVENVQGKLLSEVIISKGNYPGREITVKVEPNTVLTAQIILKENRVYQLLVVTPSDKLFTSQRREFFDSFKILR
ncbi:MAG: hypothetical protein WBJ43_04155, partial [Smithellaceae bacterium]